MERASRNVAAGAFVGAVLLIADVFLPHSAARASMTADGAGMLASGLGCGPAETPVGAGVPGLLARVRAEAAGASPRERGATQAQSAERSALRKPARPSMAAPQFAKKAPLVDRGPQPAVLRSFYTCNTAPAPNLAEGTGWRLVGPLRHG